MVALTRVLAVLLPVAVVAFALLRLGDGRSADAQREFENAGHLLNGTVLKVPVGRAIAERMDPEPRLVVIGNSFANTNVLVPKLASSLGIEPRDATRLSIPNTIGVHWYALLAHHVFREGRRPPDVIVLIADLQSLLLVDPLSEGSHGNLAALLGGPDPVVDARVSRPRSYWWVDVQERRERVRRGALDTVRDLAVWPLLHELPDVRRRHATNEHMDRVFHASQLDPELPRGSLPITVDAEGSSHRLDQLPSPEDSFVPLLADLCASHGTRLVVVRNRVSPAMPADRGDRVPPGTEARIRRLLEERGGVLLELDRLEMGTDLYANLDHMNDEGARRFTLALAEALADLGVGERPLVAPPRVGPVRTDGSGPIPADVAEVAGIRRSWTAIPAGGSASWEVAPWTGPPDGWRVRVVLEPFGDAVARATVGARPVPLERLPSGRWVGELAGEPPDGPVDIAVHADGGAIVVQGIEVGAGWTPAYAVGYRPDVRGHALELLGRAEVFDGRVWFDSTPVRAERSTPLRPPASRMVKGPGLAAGFDLPTAKELSDLATRSHTPRHARCSPVRVLEDGALLPTANVGCKEVRDLGEGRSCHPEGRVFFAASDRTHPRTNGRRYTLTLDPERRCDGGFWAYPGDALALQVPPDRLRELRDGVARVEVQASAVQREPTSFVVHLEVDGRIVQSQRPRADELDRVAFDVVPPIPPDASVALRFENPDDTFVLVTSARLRPPPMPW